MNIDEESALHRQLEIKHKLSTLSPSIKKPQSTSDVQLAMEQMDEINKTGFTKWIKAESNVSYLCSYKGHLILEYVNQDAKSAMHALEWLIEGWSVESVAELVLKLFYSCNISSLEFSERLYSLIHSWDLLRIAALIPILLIGEPISVCSSFFSHWYMVSGWEVGQMSELVVPLADGMRWSATQLNDFLLDTVVLLVKDRVVQKSMMMVIEDEINNAINYDENVIDRFELLYCIILDERNKVSSISHDKHGLEDEFDNLKLREE